MKSIGWLSDCRVPINFVIFIRNYLCINYKNKTKLINICYSLTSINLKFNFCWPFCDSCGFFLFANRLIIHNLFYLITTSNIHENNKIRCSKNFVNRGVLYFNSRPQNKDLNNIKWLYYSQIVFSTFLAHRKQCIYPIT